MHGPLGMYQLLRTRSMFTQATIQASLIPRALLIIRGGRMRLHVGIRFAPPVQISQAAPGPSPD